MARDPAQHAQHVLESVLGSDRARILARVVRIVGDLQYAEDALQDACVDAARDWVNVGVPLNPPGWLVTVARRRAIDRFRSLAATSRREKSLFERTLSWEEEPEDGPVPDDRLRLIFTCCHPALAPEVQVALTLHVVGGLTTAEIASAFMVTETTMAQRITRGKRKIRDAHIEYRVPGEDELAPRLVPVLATVYLIFTTGYLAPTGATAVRVDLLDEALRLVDVVTELLVDDAEVLGLAALMHLTDARRASRIDVAGLPIDLAHQDRSRWDSHQINLGLTLLSRARTRNAPGPYQFQAAIAAVHARASDADQTDWAMITTLYDGLVALAPSPVVSMNRAVAIGLSRGPLEGLALLDDPALEHSLRRHHRYHVARGHLLELAGDHDGARRAWGQALELPMSAHERASLVEHCARRDDANAASRGPRSSRRDGASRQS
jgi:RNA polymerase sigma-70 factor, ECF subfamily